MHRTTSPDPKRAVAAWLFACCALVFAMVVVGGITRLTHSGLSIVEWQPVIGAVPPLDDGQWQAEFDKYKSSPEYRQRNFDMTLAGFKGIFWWEYGHRLLGRLIGAAFLVPFLYFLARGVVRGALAWRLAGIFLLGGMQGAVGWLMVASGLVDDPRVSSVRLAAHLGIAFLIYGAMLWVALGLSSERGRARERGPRALVSRLRGPRLRDGALGGTGRRHPRGTRLQHVPAHERPVDSRRDPADRAPVEELHLQHGHRAAGPPRDRGARGRGCDHALVDRAPRGYGAARTRLGQRPAGRSRIPGHCAASPRCSCGCRFRSRRSTRRARSSCSPAPSGSRTRCRAAPITTVRRPVAKQ